MKKLTEILISVFFIQISKTYKKQFNTTLNQIFFVFIVPAFLNNLSNNLFCKQFKYDC